MSTHSIQTNPDTEYHRRLTLRLSSSLRDLRVRFLLGRIDKADYERCRLHVLDAACRNHILAAVYLAAYEGPTQ